MQLRAFISYRRSDALMPSKDNRTSVDFISTFTEGLVGAGFSTVFVDQKDFREGDHYERILRRDLADADLVVAVIGTRWLSLINEKQLAKRRSRSEEGIVLREIRAALNLKRRFCHSLLTAQSCLN